jgi:Na+-transporting methylmalonyl-CoA/oxaloacetate decarboxylase gamma subunit
VCYNPAALKRSIVPARRFYLLLMLGCAFLGRVHVTHAAPLPLDDYKQLVAEAYAAAQRSDRIGLDERASRLVEATEVLLADGTRLPVDNRWLATALAEEPPAYPMIVARLGAILDALGQPRTEHDPDALRKLDAIYEAPPFKSREVPSAWTRFWRSVGNAILRFLEALFGNLPAPPVPAGPGTSFAGVTPVGWALLVAGLLLVIGILVYAIRGVRRSVVAEARAWEEAAEEETLTTVEAIDRAQADAQAGNYRGAARHLYLSSLLWLEERGLLRYDRSRTNREYLQQLRGKRVHDSLAPVVETFERVWYGHRPFDADSFREYERQVAALRDGEERPA